jgi:transposase InsO family protein
MIQTTLKYLLRIDPLLLAWQPSCPKGGSSDHTAQCEGPVAVPVGVRQQAVGSRQCPDNPAVAGAVRVAVGTIQRVLRNLGVPRLRRTRKRVPRRMKLFEKAEPGKRTPELKLVFLAELCRPLPFRIRKLQCDDGQEFPLPLPWRCSRWAFAIATSVLDGPSRTARCRIDQEEFLGRHRFSDFDAAAVGLRAWEATYNYQRFSLALQGRTSAEQLARSRPLQPRDVPKPVQRTAETRSILTRPNIRSNGT